MVLGTMVIFCNRLRILLQGADQRMAHLVIGYNAPFFLTQYPVLLLLAHEDNLHRFKKIRLGNGLPPLLYSQDCRLIDHIGQI